MSSEMTAFPPVDATPSKNTPLQLERLNSRQPTLTRPSNEWWGVATLKTSPDQPPGPCHRVLVIKRAASEEAFPNAWGACRRSCWEV